MIDPIRIGRKDPLLCPEYPAEAAPARVVDLMEALKASVAAAKSKTPSAGAAAKRASAKRSAAKRPAAKTAAKKTPATRKKAAAG